MSARAKMLLAAAAAAAGSLIGCRFDPNQINWNTVAQGARQTVASARPLSTEEEAEIGGTVAACVIGPRGVVKDEGATRYVNLITAAVAGRSSRPELLPKVMILDAAEPNAFACPGGYLFVTSGLLKICKDESELAGVLSHEFTHVAAKHSIGKMKWQGVGSGLLTAGSGFTPSQVQQAYQALKPMVEAVKNEVVNNKHGTDAEKEADLTGAECAARAGYDGAGLARVVERMQEGAAGNTGWKEFSIYPDGSTRGQRIVALLKDKKLDGRGATNVERYRRELGRLVR